MSKVALVEEGQIIELGEPLFLIYTHPVNPGRFFAVSETQPYFCLEAGSITEAAKQAENCLDSHRDLKTKTAWCNR